MDKVDKTSLRNIAKCDQWSAEFCDMINDTGDPVVAVRQALMMGLHSKNATERWVFRLAAMKWQELLDQCIKESEATNEN